MATALRQVQPSHFLNEKTLLSGEIGLREALEDYSLRLPLRSNAMPWNLPGLIAVTDLATYNGFG